MTFINVKYSKQLLKEYCAWLLEYEKEHEMATWDCYGPYSHDSTLFGKIEVSDIGMVEAFKQKFSEFLFVPIIH